ncbi:MAG: aminoglycoside phosphotransferase family protein [Armatimonadota bacterium]
MADDWATQFTEETLAKVDAFIAAHPEYTRRGVEQPGQGATNRVIFARRGGELVVLKVFCEAERKERECFGLRHWRDTGLVPEVIWEDSATLLVMTYVPGVYLSRSREDDGEAIWRAGCRETGRAIGALTQVPLDAADREAFESQFYRDTPTLVAYLGRILSLGRSINDRDPDFRGDYWRASLDFIEAELPRILAQPAVLYHQDVGNLHVQHGSFMGFFDLEMCRVGCAAMQLGSALGFDEEFDDGGAAGWPPFREGWETATGRPLGAADLRAAWAARLLLEWRVISRYLSYDGTPGTGYPWATPADPVRCRTSLDAIENMIGVERR